MAVHLHGIAPGGTETLPERFERKYYLTPREVGLAYGLLRQTCPLARQFPSERINSVYFDTADLDQHERSASGDFHKDKVRIRWYGDDDDLQQMQTAFIELKSRRGFASTKQRRRLQVPAACLAPANLSKGIVPATLLTYTLAEFGYFPSDILLPIVKISYWRYRFTDMMTEQRISLDCHIRSTMVVPGWGNGEKELELPGGVIEIKGKDMQLSETLRRIRMLYTDWTRFSKYSACIDSHQERPGSIGRLSPSGRVVTL